MVLQERPAEHADHPRRRRIEPHRRAPPAACTPTGRADAAPGARTSNDAAWRRPGRRQRSRARPRYAADGNSCVTPAPACRWDREGLEPRHDGRERAERTEVRRGQGTGPAGERVDHRDLGTPMPCEERDLRLDRQLQQLPVGPEPEGGTDQLPQRALQIGHPRHGRPAPWPGVTGGTRPARRCSPPARHRPPPERQLATARPPSVPRGKRSASQIVGPTNGLRCQSRSATGQPPSSTSRPSATVDARPLELDVRLLEQAQDGHGHHRLGGAVEATHPLGGVGRTGPAPRSDGCHPPGRAPTARRAADQHPSPAPSAGRPAATATARCTTSAARPCPASTSAHTFGVGAARRATETATWSSPAAAAITVRTTPGPKPGERRPPVG